MIPRDSRDSGMGSFSSPSTSFMNYASSPKTSASSHTFSIDSILNTDLRRTKLNSSSLDIYKCRYCHKGYNSKSSARYVCSHPLRLPKLNSKCLVGGKRHFKFTSDWKNRTRLHSTTITRWGKTKTWMLEDVWSTLESKFPKSKLSFPSSNTLLFKFKDNWDDFVCLKSLSPFYVDCTRRPTRSRINAAVAVSVFLEHGW